jgi:hypothetical protein
MDGRPLPRLALAALLVTLLAAAPAAAADSPATRWPAGGGTLRVAMSLGAERWGFSPCAGKVAVGWAALGNATNARSWWANDVDPFSAPSANVDCEIALSTQVDWDWPKLCTVVIHEVGHLTGHDHVDDPDDLMNATYLRPAPECADTPAPVETGPPPAAAKQASAPPHAKPKAKAKRRAPARRRHR